MQNGVSFPLGRFLLLVFTFVFQLSSLSAYAGDYYNIIYVADFTVECTSNKDQKCLLFRENPNQDWQVLQEKINGFDYQSGNTYCLLLRLQTDSVTQQTHYFLEEIKSKTNVSYHTKDKKASVFDKQTKWNLYKLKTKNELKIFTVAKAILVFDTLSNKIQLKLNCAQYFGSCKVEENMLTFSDFVVENSDCKKRSAEEDIIKTLTWCNAYKIRKNELLLFRDNILLSVWLRKK